MTEPAESSGAGPRARFGWIGILLGPVVTFVAVVSYYFPPIVHSPFLRDFPWINLPLALLGLGLSLAGVVGSRGAGFRWPRKLFAWSGAALSTFFAGLFCVYIFALSYWMPAQTAITQELGTVPDLVLPDHEGRSFSLADLRGRKAVLVFFRGHW